jgi:hypothetical protein
MHAGNGLRHRDVTLAASFKWLIATPENLAGSPYLYYQQNL